MNVIWKGMIAFTFIVCLLVTINYISIWNSNRIESDWQRQLAEKEVRRRTWILRMVYAENLKELALSLTPEQWEEVKDVDYEIWEELQDALNDP